MVVVAGIFYVFLDMLTLCPRLHVSEEFAHLFYFEEYFAHLRIQGLSIHTISFYMETIERFIRYSEFQSHKDFDSFMKIKFACYNITKRNITNNSVSKYHKCIKKYCDFLKENELVEKVYINQIQRVRVMHPMPKSMSEEDIQKMREYVMQMNPENPFLQMRNYILIETFLYTGIRRSEAVKLKKLNVHDTHILIEQGKGAKDRIIYVPRYFSKQLQDWIDIQKRNVEYVFCDRSGSQLSGNAIGCIFKRIEKHLGFRVHPHLLRHTYASICIKRGINLYTLQQQMGHTSLKTTSIYLYLNSKENMEEMQKLKI